MSRVSQSRESRSLLGPRPWSLGAPGGLRPGFLLPLVVWLLAVPAAADTTLVHLVRPGETIPSIADLYYGDARLREVLIAENRLLTEGGGPYLVPGMRLTIPTANYHVADVGDTWADLAKRYYSEPRRAFALIEANNGIAGAPPDPGAELLVPYPLCHVVGPNQTLRGIAKTYYDDPNGARLLRRFNALRSNRVQRGQILLVPMGNLQLSDSGRKFAQEQGALPQSTGDVREKQIWVNEQLPDLRDHVRKGRFTAAVALANHLLGQGDLSGNQKVTIQRELGTALVALGEENMATEAFAAAVKQQPDLELDSLRSSPRVLKVFEKGRALARKEAEETRAPSEGSVMPVTATKIN